MMPQLLYCKFRLIHKEIHKQSKIKTFTMMEQKHSSEGRHMAAFLYSEITDSGISSKFTHYSRLEQHTTTTTTVEESHCIAACHTMVQGEPCLCGSIMEWEHHTGTAMVQVCCVPSSQEAHGYCLPPSILSGPCLATGDAENRHLGHWEQGCPVEKPAKSECRNCFGSRVRDTWPCVHHTCVGRTLRQDDTRRERDEFLID